MTTALLIHSGGFTSRQWRKLGELLAPTHAILAPDLIGYGADRYPLGTPFEIEQDIERLIGMLPEQPADLVGHSYGGLLALLIAIRVPDRVRRIAVYEPVAFGILDDPETQFRPYQPDDGGIDEAWLAGFVDWWNGAGAWTKLPEPTKQAFRDVGWKLSEEVRSLSADRTGVAGYRTITAPTLILGGATSPLAEQRVLDTLAATLPHATLERFAEMGHMGPITHAAKVNAAIAAFLV